MSAHPKSVMEKERTTALSRSKGGSVEQKEAKRFYSSGEARSFIRGIAYQLAEEDPELMMEFLNTLDIANATLVSWLIEEKETENSCLRVDSAESREFQLAVGRLKVTLAKLSDSKCCNIKQVADKIFPLDHSEQQKNGHKMK